ncbi:protein-export chaperone SecB [Clostridium tertium]|uniref:Protein-export chaperone SecB n=1 Tax=Clostridium tertium TaxID=1559 RepID=A0A9X3XN34_9CLOT|nr:protein-export chaperone SecB [Clostridium tertium]MDC4241301.1 protein-export chaperone SecB [Clostridium tertium]
MKANLKFKDYVVNSIEFKNNLSFDNSPVEIDFDINSEVNFISDKEFFLGLEIEIFREPEKNNYPFNFKAEIIGTFEIDTDNEVEKNKLAEQNSVAILFPYVRALISTYTSASNVSPIILPPINVVKYIQNKKKKGI